MQKHPVPSLRSALAAATVLLAAACSDLSDGPATPERRKSAAPVDKALVSAPARLAGVASVPAGDSVAMEIRGGNPYYNVYVRDDGWGRGLYTVATGPDHPITRRFGSQNVLYGGQWGFAGTSYNTVRSYSSGTDYVQSGYFASSAFNVIHLTDYAPTVEPEGATGFRTTYDIAAPDRMRIAHVVKANGTTFANSSVEVTTTITNTGSTPLLIGIRYLWDYMIAGDDGPELRLESPSSGPYITESTYSPALFGFYKLQDNSSAPTFAVYGTNTGPATLLPTPSGSTTIKHAAWPLVFNSAFDYETTGQTVSARPGWDDNAILTYVGDKRENAVSIAPGASFTFTHSIFSSPADDTPPPFTPPTAPTNHAPVARAGLDFSRECRGLTPVRVDASASTDADGDALSYEWRNGSTVIGTNAAADVPLPIGSHTLTLTVSDGRGGASSDDVQVNIVDTEAPQVMLSATPGTIWPPDHKYVAVAVQANVSDACAGTSELTLAGSVVSNEADDENGVGDGNTTGDIRVTRADGTVLLSSNAMPRVWWAPGASLELRAERRGTEAPRVYSIELVVKDPSGNASIGRAAVSIAHDQR